MITSKESPMTLHLISIQSAIPGSHPAGNCGSRPLVAVATIARRPSATHHPRRMTHPRVWRRSLAEAEGDSAANPGDSSTEEEAARYVAHGPVRETFVPSGNAVLLVIVG